MRWLLWKEYRQNRLAIYTTLAILIVPHLIAIYASVKWPNDYGGAAWVRNLTASSMYGLVLSHFGLALIGGNMIAGERADRSAEFQAYLPISRRKILTAKILLSVTIAVVILLPNCVVLWETLLDPRMASSDQFIRLRAAYLTATSALVCFCTAWLFSSILRSPTFSVAGGLIVTWFLATAIVCRTLRPGLGLLPLIITPLHVIGLTLSAMCFGLGTWLYLRRVEP